MDNQTIHIACNIDSKYTRFCGVLMVSLFENNQNEHIKMHILCYHLTVENKKDLQDIASQYNNEIQFYDVDESIFKEFPISEQWPIVIYFRLILPSLLNKSVKRVLYMDCDIVCRGALRELYFTNMENQTICAVEDILNNFPALYNRMDYSPRYGYFNSGVLLIDLFKWQNLNITNKCIDYIRNNHVIHPDQDALNIALHNQKTAIDSRWNYISNYHTRYISIQEYKEDLYKTKKYYPILVHFTGTKPWSNRCDSPFKVEWMKYQEKTKWKDLIPQHTIKQVLIHKFALLLDKIGVRKYNHQKLF